MIVNCLFIYAAFRFTRWWSHADSLWIIVMSLAAVWTLCLTAAEVNYSFKGIVHFEIKIWYLSAYPKGIQDVGVFFLQ